MASESTNTPVPEWADRAMDVMPTLIPESGIERDLLDAAFILLRGKYGRSTLPNPKDIARGVILEALAGLNSARPVDKVISEMELTLAQLKTFRDAEAAS